MLNILRRRDPAQIVLVVVTGIAIDVVDLVSGAGRRPVEGAAHEAVRPEASVPLDPDILVAASSN